MDNKKYYYNGPDGFDGGDLGIYVSDDGFDTFSEAKRELIKSIDTAIWTLKEFRKEVRAIKKSEVTEYGS
jgi:hypothetical protein